MNYLLCLYLLENLIINFSYVQNIKYCDKDKNCDSCTICGVDTKNYCSCNFYNIYCQDTKSNQHTILSDFLFSYDGCLTSNNENEDICGDSNQIIDIGIYKTITFKSSAQKNFVCFYNIKKINNNNNDINIILKKETNEQIYFNLHFVVYYNYDQIKISSRINSLVSSNHLEIIELEAEKISMYVDIPDGNSMDKISISFGIDDTEVKKIKNKKNKKISEFVIYGIVFGILIILIIVFIICFVKRCRDLKKNNNLNKPQNQIKNNEIQKQISVIKVNKEKIDNLFKDELKPKIFNKLNTSNNCFNCTICLEDFKDGKSLVLDTKCQHRFHFKCFKNWVYKNILIPKCPNCNLPILDVVNKNNLTINTSSIVSPYPQNSFNNTTTLGNFVS